MLLSLCHTNKQKRDCAGEWADGASLRLARPDPTLMRADYPTITL